MQHPDTSRVIVTTIGDDGRSGFHEKFTDAVTDYDGGGIAVYRSTQLWGTADGIGAVGDGVNPDIVTDPWFPGPGGVRFRFFTFLPPVRDAAGNVVIPQLQDATSESSNFTDAFDDARPGMHISDSVDFVHVLSGEVVLEMENGETVVTAGDIIIMRGGWHNFRNDSDAPCTVASVMVGAHRQQT